MEELLKEFEQLASTDKDFNQAVFQLLNAIESSDSISQDEWRELIWQVFFPDGCNPLQAPEYAIEKLTQDREVTIKQQASGITSPAKQILLTSNALITVPLQETDINSLDYSILICQVCPGYQKCHSSIQDLDPGHLKIYPA